MEGCYFMAKFEPQQGDWKHTLYGTDQGEWLVGYSSDDTIWAQGGDDRADGVHGTDILDGGDGNDTLNGGTGTDYLTGGLGGDYFLVDKNGGWDVIYDFHPEQGDEIFVNLGGQDTYTTATEDGDTYINFGNGEGLVLVGVTTFSADYLTFV
jgi:Ca2+-binding RTX toxin-like protein